MSRYIPATEQDRSVMLQKMGYSRTDELFRDIPEAVRLNRALDLPEPLSELELAEHMKELAAENRSSACTPCFLGAGVYDHFIPSVVHHVLSRSEFYTAYTPYQPEISQGTLQAIFEYQTMICRLTGMEVSNASMYDGATAVAEAAMMAVRSTGKKLVAVSEGVHPEYRRVLKTYARFNGFEAAEIGLENGTTDMNKLAASLKGGCAGVILQNPNYLGSIEDLDAAFGLASRSEALSIACVDPISLAVLKTPGECGADIAVGDGQPLGNPMNFGGPGLGFMAVKKEHVRKMPGRIAGMTTDHDGRRGFVLTLQAREQHIRREKAVSNICSNQALNALAACVYLAAMGRQGLKETANLCLQKAHYTYDRLLATGRFEKVSDAPFFKEFAVKAVKEPIGSINARLLQHGITGGLDLTGFAPYTENCCLVAVTEKRTREEIDKFVSLSAEGGKM